MFLKSIYKVYEFIIKKKYIYNSKKISFLIKKSLPKNFYFYIIDVGAGARYLRSVLNFDGSSKIIMIDPNENLNISVKNLVKEITYKKNIIPIKSGLYLKNTTLDYYQAKIPTSSSFIKYDKKLTSIRKKVFKFSTIKKRYKIKNIDILKIDIEGLELEILKSILKFKYPLIIEIEVNFKNSLYGDTFTKIHNLLSKRYTLETIFPTYQNSKNYFRSELKNFSVGTYASPVNRNSVIQMDCYYTLNKKNYSINDLLLFLGYGFINKANKLFKDKRPNTTQIQRENFLKILKIVNNE